MTQGFTCGLFVCLSGYHLLWLVSWFTGWGQYGLNGGTALVQLCGRESGVAGCLQRWCGPWCVRFALCVPPFGLIS
jgi:hypothetical protein